MDAQSFLFGRELLRTEIPFDIANELAQGLVYQVAGISEERVCRRCGNHDARLFASYPCFCCKRECIYCRKCIMMGRISTCTPLYGWSGSPLQFGWSDEQVALQWEGNLSPSQTTSSKEIVEAVHTHTERLIWAVCGAGKTEMIFAGIEAALREHKRVCITSPRTDVILELAPRLRQAFPGIEVAALYGGSDQKNRCAPLTLATTHQLMRFANTFELLIVDEVDAFPFSYDKSLEYAVKKARTQSSTLIFLTATPSSEWKEVKHVLLPARFHRKPIPTPELQWIGNWKRKIERNQLPKQLHAWCQSVLDKGHPFLLFFPTIDLMEKTLSLFNINGIAAVHSADPKRKEKVMELRDNKLVGLLTTTILERGVTIPNVDVAVIGSEEQIFTESALVQIAGRVGRSKQCPTGEVIFFHYGKTVEMLAAVRHIDKMNKEAVRRELIDVD